MSCTHDVNLTPVEQGAIEDSPLAAIYAPDENTPVITVDNFPALGRLAAMRFMEWVQHNPGGVISLPTGKTPEHFIKWVERLLATWDTPQTPSHPVRRPSPRDRVPGCTRATAPGTPSAHPPGPGCPRTPRPRTDRTDAQASGSRSRQSAAARP